MTLTPPSFASLDRLEQTKRLLRSHFPQGDGPGATLVINSLTAHEELSSGFLFEVELLSDDVSIPLKSMIGKMMTVSLVRDNGTERHFNGYITEFRYAKTDGGFVYYHAVLEPWLAFARLRMDCVSFLATSVNVLAGRKLGGWFKNASPAQRQLNFDPNATEVDYYKYTESKARFDPEGKETRESDTRHGNVPDGLSAIPPLLGTGWSFSKWVAKNTEASPAQIARWRGWSEVLFGGAYGQMLQHAERYLNNMMHEDEMNEIWKSVLKDPKAMGASGGAALTEDNIKSIAKCWYPVHSLGYNFLKSNGESAKSISKRIAGLVAGYKKRGFDCSEVIIVTHSMGGLVARALFHPRYGNLLSHPEFSVLGVYHNVMPSSGAAATYKRMRFGFKEGSGVKAELAARVLSIDGEHATAILANAQGPLELLPGGWYGTGWLKVVDGKGSVLDYWPKEEYGALEHIYLKPDAVWWRLINSKWVNPAGLSEDEGAGIKSVYRRIAYALDFVESIRGTFHPTATYAREALI